MSNHTQTKVKVKSIEEVYRRGFVAFVDHERKVIRIEFNKIDRATMRHASKLVEYFAGLGYDNE